MKNQYATFGDKTVIFCVHKDEPYDVVIDTEDLQLVIGTGNGWKIHKKRHQKNPTVYTFTKDEYVPLRHLLAGKPPEGKFVTHKDRDFMNFSRHNLITVDDSERHFYKELQKNSKTGVRGVNWYKKSKSWRTIYKGKGYGFYKDFDIAKEVVELVRKDDFEGNLKDRQHYIGIYKKLDKEKLKEANQ